MEAIKAGPVPRFEINIAIQDLGDKQCAAKRERKMRQSRPGARQHQDPALALG